MKNKGLAALLLLTGGLVLLPGPAAAATPQCFICTAYPGTLACHCAKLGGAIVTCAECGYGSLTAAGGPDLSWLAQPQATPGTAAVSPRPQSRTGDGGALPSRPGPGAGR